MLNLSDWVSAVVKSSEDVALKKEVRASEAWRRIRENPTAVTFRTPQGANLTPQVVRLESDNSASPAESTPGIAPSRKIIVFGIKDHPTIPATDMKENYTFIYSGDIYICIDVIDVFGERQGIFEARG